jgi:hypothetical protein
MTDSRQKCHRWMILNSFIRKERIELALPTSSKALSRCNSHDEVLNARSLDGAMSAEQIVLLHEEKPLNLEL